MKEIYYTYILQSEKDGKKYAGYTKDLKLRFNKHQKGEVFSTKDRRPLKIIYFEGCLNQDNAKKREKYFKTYGNRQAEQARVLGWMNIKKVNYDNLLQPTSI